MTHLPQMPAAAAAFSQPEFSLGNAAQVLHVRTLEFLGKRFPSGVVGVWEHADVEGEVFGFKTDHKVITLRLGPELYLVIPFVQCQRGDLATAVRLQTFFNGVTRETPQVLIVAVMMTQEEVQMAKELHFEVISLLTDLPQDGTGAAPTTGNNNATQTTTRTSRRQSVMWDSVFEVSAPPPNSKALPEVKSWDDFFKLLKLTPEKAKEYADCFTNEALELEQLADLDRKMLKEFGLPIGVQVRILRLAARLQERTELRAADKKAAAPAAPAPAPVPTPAAALLTPTNSLDGSERRGASPTPFSAPVSVPVPVVASPAPAASAGPGSPAPVHPSVYLPLSTSPARAPASPLRPAIKVSALPPPPTVPTQHLRISSVLLPPPPPPLQFEGLPMPMALPPPPPPQSPHSPAP